MSINEDKKRSVISSRKVKDCTSKIKQLQKEIEEYRKLCSHNYEVLNSTWGWDGWSQVECELEEYVHCKICGNETYRKTGRTKVFS